MDETVRRRVPLLTGLLTLVSLGLVVGAVTGALPSALLPRAPAWLFAAIPHVNAALSLTAIVTIVAGVRWIRRGAVARHRRAMLVSLALFATFLLLYLYRVAVLGPTEFAGPELLYTYLYLPLLAVHMLLAVVCIPLLYYVLLLALTHPVAALGDTSHPRIGRVAAALWVTSFALGVVVYAMLYWLF
jgi:putative membrane protein